MENGIKIPRRVESLFALAAPRLSGDVELDSLTGCENFSRPGILTFNSLTLESETFWGRNQAEDLRFSLARRSAKATHSSTSFLSRL